VRPPLLPLETREERFDFAVGSGAEVLRSDDDGIPRWTIHPDEQRIVLYRLPIERLSHLHREDDLHRRMMIEGAVFRAAAEYLDRDPWDLGPERFRYF